MSPSDVVGEEPCADRFPKPSCLSSGFEGLNFVTDALVSSAPYPFRFERQWLENIGDAAELAPNAPGMGCVGKRDRDIPNFLRRTPQRASHKSSEDFTAAGWPTEQTKGTTKNRASLIINNFVPTIDFRNDARGNPLTC